MKFIFNYFKNGHASAVFSTDVGTGFTLVNPGLGYPQKIHTGSIDLYKITKRTLKIEMLKLPLNIFMKLQSH
jgi:hypothetical protein